MGTHRFGTSLVCALAIRTEGTELPRRRRIEGAILALASGMPRVPRAKIEVSESLTGISIAQYEEFVAAAMGCGLLSRLGRDRYVVEPARYVCADILAMGLRGMPEWAVWFDRVAVEATRPEPSVSPSQTAGAGVWG